MTLRTMLSRAAVLVAVLAVSACARKDADPGKPVPMREAESAAFAALDPSYDDQVEHYSAKECVVCGMALGAAGGPVDLVHDGKLVRVCSDVCRAKFEENPAPFMTERNSALIATQLITYPTDKCVVSENKLDAYGAPINLLWGTRLVRVCRKTCEQQFHETPSDFIAALDALGDVKAVEAGAVPPLGSK